MSDNLLVTPGCLSQPSMNAAIPQFDSGSLGRTERQTAQANATSLRWTAIDEAGKVVTVLAGKTPGRPDHAITNFPTLIHDADIWRQQLAEDRCIDLAAVMESGLAALMTINARGGDCRAAAEALLEEFTAARAAIVSLAIPPATHERARPS